MPFIPEAIIKYEHDKILSLQQKYEKMIQSNIILPPHLHSIVNARTHPVKNFEIETLTTTPLSAKVTSRYESERFTHIINLSVNPQLEVMVV